jgi:DNA-directed RNA polymerase subunit alpha
MKTIVLPKKPKFIKNAKNEAVFEIEGCYPGYGNTLGNALRRVLLSSLPGSAITKVVFKDADHEFSTIPGVKENIVQIILNLKKLRFLMHKDEPVEVKLKAQGDKTVKAKDIQVPSSVEVVTPDLEIANLTKKTAKLEMSLTIEKGMGYTSTENREKDSNGDIKTIEIDTLFTPIQKVNYEVTNMRVGKRTDFDKLTFTIQTDGSITPEDAFREASSILVNQFAALAQVDEKKVLKEVAKELEEKEETIEDIEPELEAEIKEELAKPKKVKKVTKKKIEAQKIKVEDLNISKRLAAILKENGLEMIGDIVDKSEDELKNIEGVGDKGIKEVKKSIGTYGVILKEDE